MRAKIEYSKHSLIILLCVGGLFLTLFFNNCSYSSTKSSNTLDSIALQNPRGYAYFDNRENKWDIKISGEIMNKSTTCGYKDFVVEVQYLSQTKTLLLTKQYTIFQSIKPFYIHSFNARLNDNAPEGSSILRWKLIGASQMIDGEE